jgi:PAS domain S-box-containing protein
MRTRFYNRRFSTRLISGFFILILLTTLSAGLPAYWLTRAQLERQVWSHLAGTQQATQSLLQAERSRLADLTELLAERPTLKQLIQAGNPVALKSYLTTFQIQSALDLLVLCDPTDQPVIDNQALGLCPTYGEAQFVLIDDQPALLVSRYVQQEPLGDRLGLVVTGIRLDKGFLERLANDTGAGQSLLLPNDTRLSSSLAGTVTFATTVPPQAENQQRRMLDVNGQRYYAIQSSLPGPDGLPLLITEAALPVDDLIATENQALTILAASTGLVVIVGLILAVWYVRQVTAPLQALTGVARRISAGELMAEIPTFPDPIEISTLARALQRSQASMLAALAERSQARDWLNNLIQSIVEGVVTFDQQGRITFLSQGAEVLLGQDSATALGRSINDLLPLTEGDDGQFSDHIPAPGGKSQIGVLTHDNKPVVLSITGAQQIPPNGETPQVALVLRDVTQEETARRLHSYFLANISHEFLTPLSTLNAAVELLMHEAETMSPTEIRELLKPTYLSLLGLQTLIDNLLQSSRIEAGQFTLKRQPVDLNQIIAGALAIVQPLFERRRHPGRGRLDDLSPGDPATVITAATERSLARLCPRHR